MYKPTDCRNTPSYTNEQTAETRLHVQMYRLQKHALVYKRTAETRPHVQTNRLQKHALMYKRTAETRHHVQTNRLQKHALIYKPLRRPRKRWLRIDAEQVKRTNPWRNLTMMMMMMMMITRMSLIGVSSLYFTSFLHLYYNKLS